MLNNGMPVSAAYNDGVTFHKKLIERQFAVKGSGTVPKIGSIILINEIIKWQDRKLARPFRGCGVVSYETEYLVFIDGAIFPGYFIKMSFPKTDFISGIVQYVQLKELVYKKETTYNDLDIRKLTDKIKDLVIDL
jgi:hypothetical protein